MENIFIDKGLTATTTTTIITTNKTKETND